ncbi:MBL fold metallo-hydrolase [Exilibacterium tricleocarpae]|nr:MBL fold metallo-hydrolase [Exilibacterium tricleocarpae]
MDIWQVGEVKITRVVEQVEITDGRFVIQQAAPENVKPHTWLQPHYADDQGRLVFSIHAFVVESEDCLIVVDTCVGNFKNRDIPNWHQLQTTFMEDFIAAGFDPLAVDKVLCTHLHDDHVGWNTQLVDGRWVPTFANAKYLLAQQEWQAWHRRDGFEEILSDSVRPIIDAGLMEFIEPPHAVTGEVKLVPTPGHTPGHVSVEIASGNARAVITGDIMHNPVQCAEPDWQGSADRDPDRARSTRHQLLEQWCNAGVLVLGTHFPTPTGGRVIRAAEHWRFDPANPDRP